MGGQRKSDINKGIILDLFQIRFASPARASLHIQTKELGSVSQKIAVAANRLEVCIPTRVRVWTKFVLPSITQWLNFSSSITNIKTNTFIFPYIITSIFINIEFFNLTRFVFSLNLACNPIRCMSELSLCCHLYISMFKRFKLPSINVF